MVARFAPGGDRRARTALTVVAAFALVLVYTQLILPGASTGGARGTPVAKLFQGAISGCVTALVATGLILVYRTTRIINFAVTAIGAIGAELTFRLVQLTGVPFVLAFLAGVVIAGAIGLAFDLGFVRRFFNAPRLVLTVVTIAVAGNLLFFRTQVINLPFFPDDLTFEEFAGGQSLRPLLPFPGFTFRIGDFGIPFGFPELFALEVAVLCLLVVAGFLRFTRAGVAVRAMAENPERASLLGISVGSLSSIVWTIAGVLSGVAIMATGFIDSPAQSAGLAPGVLVPAFAAAVLARFRSIPIAVAVSILISVVVSATDYSYSEDTQLVAVALLVTMGVALLLQRRSGRSEAGAAQTWQASEESRPVPKELSSLGSIRATRYVLAGLMLAAVIAYPFLVSTGAIVLGATVALGSIVALSLVVLTGWGGQVSLGQWGFAAVGAMLGGALSATVGIPFWLAVPLAAAGTSVLTAIIGIPAFRIPGMFLMVVTFTFALVASTVLVNERYFDWLIPTDVERPSLLFIDFEDERSMYFLCAAALVIAFVVVQNLRRSRFGRILIASRENEANLQAFGINLVRTKLLAFAASGALAGFAGAMYVHLQRGLDATSFTTAQSIQVFLAVVVGGMAAPSGAVLGTIYFSLFNYFFSANAVIVFIGYFAPLIVLYAMPQGIIGMLVGMRDAALRIIAQRRQIVVPSLFADVDPEALEQRLIPLSDASGQAGLAALPVHERFALESELYQGRGVRVVDRIAPAKPTKEAAAIAAAAESGG